eukprot:TRINITY_DN3395_c0_g2_i7.p2 TRINITY_DN3395_c0_g2~~TRINITY_DN3395_c0_g2_i7.p2  ORF type:complete len:462 (-),score=60.55 TRINITY_DN3395_c0_g2_i7:95-1480(-)
MAQALARTGEKESFAALLEESLGAAESLEGTVVKGRVVAVENDMVTIDVGLKSEGRVALKEFAVAGQPPELKAGDTVEVYLERMEDKNGEAMLSREKAKREEAWALLEKSFTDQTRVTGVIFGRVKGGFTVDLSGAVAFLPGSQVDIRPVRDVTPLMDIPQPFQILKMDRKRGNIVVSRRAVLEETRAEQRSGLIQSLAEGQIIDGVVKNITDYGAFVDLGGIDGLLHVTDLSYKRVNHPSEMLNIGDTVKVQIIRINRDFGLFIGLDNDVDGMVHMSDIAWGISGEDALNLHRKGEVVKAIVLAVEPDKDPAHLARHEAARERSVGWRRRQVPGQREAVGPRDQHHRIWCVRRAGAGHRRPGPRLGDELDQEERAPGQDRLDLAGSRSRGARGGRREAPHLARPQAGPGQSVGSLRRCPPGRHRSRGRSQERHRVRPVHRPGQRRRRHGPHVGHRLGHLG